MSTTINASTSGGLIQTADTSGVLELQSNGSTMLTVASTGVYGSLKSSVAQTASGTAVNFVDIPSWVKRVTVMFDGVSTNGTSVIQVQLGNISFVTTGYLGSSADGPTLNSTNYTTGFGIRAGTAPATIHGLLLITNINQNTWVASGNFGRSDGAAFISTGGSKALSATLDRIRITTVNGTDTFDAGTINIMYEG